MQCNKLKSLIWIADNQKNIQVLKCSKMQRLINLTYFPVRIEWRPSLCNWTQWAGLDELLPLPVIKIINTHTQTRLQLCEITTGILVGGSDYMIFLKIEIYSIEQIVLGIKPTNICISMYMYLIICFIHKDQELFNPIWRNVNGNNSCNTSVLSVKQWCETMALMILRDIPIYSRVHS